MSPSATPAKVPRCHRRLTAPKRATRSSPVPQVPRKTKVDVTKCHACHAKRRWMSPSATPATQSAAASPATKRAQARHQIQPSAASATPATQNEGSCHEVPRLPRKAKADVVKCYACHANFKVLRRHRGLSAHKRAQARHRIQPSAISATAATQNEVVAVTKCRTCHEKQRWMSPSATPASQSAAASPATKRAQAPPDPAQWPQVPRLPGKTTVDVKVAVTKCHACHAKRR